MKHFLLATFIVATIVAIAFTHSGYDTEFLKNTSGAPTGYSGDPAGGNQNCTFCHTGNPAQTVSGWITSNIPSTGYVPGTTYTITATATGTSTKFGFQISPQNVTGNFLGTLINTGNQTQLSANQKYINHTSAGTAGSGSKTWTFNWTAPPAGSGAVTFYGAFNLSNAQGNTSGDNIRLSTLTVNEDVSTSTESFTSPMHFVLFPNPVSNQIFIQSEHHSKPIPYHILNNSGQIIASGNLVASIEQIDISQLPTGYYFFHPHLCNVTPIRFFKF